MTRKNPPAHRIDVTFYRAKRMGNSRNGNPRFELHTSNGAYRMAVDSSCNYDVGNLEFQASRAAGNGVPVTLHVTGRGTVDVITWAGER